MITKYKDTYNIIGVNLRKARRKAKLTQAKLASRTAKLDASKISDMENAKEDFMFSTLLEIANALDIDVADLLRK